MLKKKILTPLFLFLLPLCFYFEAFAAKEPGRKNLDFSPKDVVFWSPLMAKSYDDGSVVVQLNLETRHNFGLYESKLEVFESEGLAFLGLVSPLTEAVNDPVTNKIASIYKEGDFTFVFTGLLPYERPSFKINLQYTGCSSKICLFPFKETIEAQNNRLPGNLPESLRNVIKQPEVTPSEVTPPKTENHKEPSASNGKMGDHTKSPEEDSLFTFNEKSFTQKLKESNSLGASLLFLLFLLLAGLATNLTPCIYPMIPITIRILAKQKTSPLLASSVYALGIMLTYTTLSIVAILGGSMFGNLLANTYVNVFLALIMFYFGLSMLGYGDYSFLQNLGNKFSSKGPGLKTAFIMGLGAGLIASPCTGPILGSLLAYSATTAEQPYMVILYFLVYSFGFSLPYVFLGKASSRLSQIKFRSSIQQVIKTLFAGVMFGLFFYYLRIPFYSFYKNLSSIWMEVASSSFALFFILTLFYMRKMLKSARILSIVLLGLSFFSFSAWLKAPSETNKLDWITDEKVALALSQKNQKPVLVDMWAEWCEVCKKMDMATFENPRVIKELKDKGWILLKFDLTEDTKENKAIYKKYEIFGLPSLVILPDGELENKLLLKGSLTPDELLKHLQEYAKE